MNNEIAANKAAAAAVIAFGDAVSKLANLDSGDLERVVRAMDCEKPKTKLIHGVESVKPQTSLFDKLRMERKEVCDKVKNLEGFMHSKAFAQLTPVNQGLLMVQLEAMRMYATTLERRIEIS